MATVRESHTGHPFFVATAAMLVIVCLTACPSLAQPFGLDVVFDGHIGGADLRARLTGSLGIGQGELDGMFQALPPAVDGPSLAAMVFALFTDTTLLPAGDDLVAPPGQTIFFLSGGNYTADRDYTFGGSPGMQLSSVTPHAQLNGSILNGDVIVNGQIPTGGGDSILSYNAWLKPCGPGLIRDAGIAELGSGLTVHWTGNHYYDGQALDKPYRITVDWPVLSLDGNTFHATFTSTAHPMRGDLNQDAWVGQADLDIVLDQWGKTGSEITDPRADVNGDDFVGQADLDYVLDEWGQGVPGECPEPATLSLLALGGLALVRCRRQ